MLTLGGGAMELRVLMRVLPVVERRLLKIYGGPAGEPGYQA
jgi:hypothetical protein